MAGTKRALICGVAGQDGGYLAELLLSKGYSVVGTSRDAQVSPFANLHALGIFDRVQRESLVLTDFRSVLTTLAKTEPDEVYNLAGQSSVALSFQQPVEALESIAVGTTNLLEAIRFIGRPIRLYSACSSECYGDIGPQGADETTPFRPKSPYAVAKATAFWQVLNYRAAFKVHACSGILFNHESPLRPERFVTRKIVAAACRITRGSKEKLRLGNVGVRRDWGWAPEYVDAMWRMLQSDEAGDYVVATGESHTLQEFLEQVFNALGLDWHQHVEIDEELVRPFDTFGGHGNAAKAARELDWSAQVHFGDIVQRLVRAEQESKADVRAR
jgi:GDPmannose 4,6-dehydratase